MFSELKICETESSGCDIFPISITSNTTVNHRYISGINMIVDANFSQNYSEEDITKCLWPRQDNSLITCSAEIVCNLSSMYSLHVGSNLNETIQFTPFSNCLNAIVLMRACDFDNSNKTNCIPIEWIEFNQREGTAMINLSKVNKVGIYNVGFQAQSYTDMYLNTYEDVITKLYNTIISLVNNNAEIVTPTFEKYVIYDKTKNFTISFTDEENDDVFINTISSSGLYAFVSSTQQK